MRYRYFLLLPCAILLFLAAPQRYFLLPSSRDYMTESPEPAKTFQLVASRGSYVHKWGPLPSLFYAPAYALVLAGTSPHRANLLNGFYTLDLDDPAVVSPLIVEGRTVSLLLSLLATLLMTVSLARNTGDARTALVVLACLSTSAVFFEPWTDTKPDGIMDALLMISLASYATIVFRGLRMGRAILTALFYVASLSCKELTSLSLLLPFVGLAVLAFRGLRQDPAEGKRQLRILATAVLASGIFYFLFNIAYAPHAWVERMHIVFGPLKNPAIWAPPQQTTLSYLREILRSTAGALGLGGVAVLVFAVIGTVLRPTTRLVMLWLPFIGHFVLTTVTAGTATYYYMLPLAPMLCLPASEVAAQWLANHRLKTMPAVLATASIVLVCGYLGLNAITVFREGHSNTLMQRSFYEVVPRGSTVNEMFLWRRTGNDGFLVPGPNNTWIDQEPVFALAGERKYRMPDYILVDTGLESFMRDTRRLPARAAMLKSETGYDYRNFPGIAQLGYEAIAEIFPTYPRWVSTRLSPNSKVYTSSLIRVFRRKEPDQRSAFPMPGAEPDQAR